MDTEHHDDGLVHGHRWATEPPRPVLQGRVIPAPTEDHDAGLDHAHGWACSERGRMASCR